jgi:uncharacterized phage protein gp47/JayE
MINIPTTEQIYSNIIADLEAQYNITIPSFGKSFLRAYASVIAGQLRLYYLLTGKVQKNIFVDTADPVAQGGTLERWGFIKLGRYPFKATQGKYEIQVSGTLGTVIPAGTTFKSDDDSLNAGYLFVVDSTYTLASPLTLEVRALTAGLESQLQVNDTMTVTAPIAGLDSQATVTNENTEPQAAEDIEEYRRKAIEAFRLLPQGGAGADYRLWASDAQGVKQSYPYTAPGDNNKVNLYVEANIADSVDGKGTPTTAILTEVESQIEDPTASRPSRKPLTDTVDYLAVTPLDIDITIDPSPFTAAEQTLIENSIEAALNDVRPFVDSIDVLSEKNDIFDTNRIVSIILQAVPGSTFGITDYSVDGSSVTTFTFEDGDIPYLNSITFV